MGEGALKIRLGIQLEKLLSTIAVGMLIVNSCWWPSRYRPWKSVHMYRYVEVSISINQRPRCRIGRVRGVTGRSVHCTFDFEDTSHLVNVKFDIRQCKFWMNTFRNVKFSWQGQGADGPLTGTGTWLNRRKQEQFRKLVRFIEWVVISHSANARHKIDLVLKVKDNTLIRKLV